MNNNLTNSSALSLRTRAGLALGLACAVVLGASAATSPAAKTTTEQRTSQSTSRSDTIKEANGVVTSQTRITSGEDVLEVTYEQGTLTIALNDDVQIYEAPIEWEVISQDLDGSSVLIYAPKDGKAPRILMNGQDLPKPPAPPAPPIRGARILLEDIEGQILDLEGDIALLNDDDRLFGVNVQRTSPPKVMLGITMSPVEPAAGKQFKLAPGHGIVVDSTIQGLPASDAGLKPLDIIVEIEGAVAPTTTDLRTMLAKKNPGDTLNLVVIREGERTPIAINLRAYDAEKMGVPRAATARGFAPRIPAQPPVPGEPPVVIEPAEPRFPAILRDKTIAELNTLQSEVTALSNQLTDLARGIQNSTGGEDTKRIAQEIATIANRIADASSQLARRSAESTVGQNAQQLLRLVAPQDGVNTWEFALPNGIGQGLIELQLDLDNLEGDQLQFMRLPDEVHARMQQMEQRYKEQVQALAEQQRAVREQLHNQLQGGINLNTDERIQRLEDMLRKLLERENIRETQPNNRSNSNWNDTNPDA